MVHDATSWTKVPPTSTRTPLPHLQRVTVKQIPVSTLVASHHLQRELSAYTPVTVTHVQVNKRLYNITNPACDDYAEPPENYRMCYSWLARRGITPPLSYCEEDTGFFKCDIPARREIYWSKQERRCIPRPIMFDRRSTIRMVMPVIVTGGPIPDSMQRLILALSNAKKDAADMFLT